MYVESMSPAAGPHRRYGCPGSCAVAQPGAVRSNAVIQPTTARAVVLLPICDPPNAVPIIVADEQRSVGHHEQSDRPTPPGAIGELPARNEILAGYRLAS